MLDFDLQFTGFKLTPGAGMNRKNHRFVELGKGGKNALQAVVFHDRTAYHGCFDKLRTGADDG